MKIIVMTHFKHAEIGQPCRIWYKSFVLKKKVLNPSSNKAIFASQLTTPTQIFKINPV